MAARLKAAAEEKRKREAADRCAMSPLTQKERINDIEITDSKELNRNSRVKGACLTSLTYMQCLTSAWPHSAWQLQSGWVGGEAAWLGHAL